MERTAADRVSDPIIGRLLDGRYRVGPRVARGGMATVYQATDTRLDRTVAVKVMHPGLIDDRQGNDDSFSRRFRREAQAAARLAHQNVVSVFDQGDDDGVLFLVMEYVSGITLRDLIRDEAPIPPAKALAVIEPVLAALASAHRAGMIHRDVKPENVLLSDDGRVKVADFGLARAVNAETQHTGTGVLIGTVSYLSPELVVAGTADARSDVYAAGVMIYEMLTGQKPHQADSPIQVAYKHVHEDIPKPSALVPTLPAYVDALVARATAREISLRPVDAGVLLQLVRRVRSTLGSGISDDPDLVADLTPGPLRRDPFQDTDDQMPVSIIDPSDDTGAWSPVEDFADDPSGRRAAAAAAMDPFSHPEAFTPYHASGASPAHEVEEVTTNLARPVPPRTKRNARPAIFIGLALVVALVIGLGAWYLGVARYTTTPGVINLDQGAASAKLQQSGLVLKVVSADYNENVANGAVISTDPRPGSRVLKDGTVKAVVSRGPERHTVPKVKGKTLDEAQALIQDAKLSFGNAVEKYDEKMPKGRVLSASPVAGTSLRREAAVDVVVSKGRKPIPVPNFTGKDAGEAENTLRGLGLSVDTASMYDDTVAKGAVIRQTPRGGTLYRGDTVSLIVSRGPELVSVPQTRAMGVGAATKLLKRRGFTVKAVKSSQYIGLGYVFSSDPRAGARVPKGSTVTLYLV